MLCFLHDAIDIITRSVSEGLSLFRRPISFLCSPVGNILPASRTQSNIKDAAARGGVVSSYYPRSRVLMLRPERTVVDRLPVPPNGGRCNAPHRPHAPLRRSEGVTSSPFPPQPAVFADGHLAGERAGVRGPLWTFHPRLTTMTSSALSSLPHYARRKGVPPCRRRRKPPPGLHQVTIRNRKRRERNGLAPRKRPLRPTS
jgi:hypothetical protein